MNSENHLSRRQFALTGALAAGAALLPARLAHAAAPFEQASLPYAFDALEPHIDAMTMEIQTPVAYVAPYGVAGCAVELPGWVENVSQAERLFTREVVSHESSPSVTVVEPVTEKKAA